MERLKRKNWSDEIFGFVPTNGIFDMIDNEIKSIYRITDEEYDYACDVLTDDELGLLTYLGDSTFTHKRKVIELLNNKIYNKGTRL